MSNNTITLEVSTRFLITVTKERGEIWANPGDKLMVTTKNPEEVYITKLNSEPIYSIWKRTAWVKAHCKKD